MEPFEVHTLKEGEHSASFKATIGILESGTAILAGNKGFNPDQFVTDKKVEDKELSDLLALSMDLKEQKKRNKGKKEEVKE